MKRQAVEEILGAPFDIEAMEERVIARYHYDPGAYLNWGTSHSSSGLGELALLPVFAASTVGYAIYKKAGAEDSQESRYLALLIVYDKRARVEWAGTNYKHALNTYEKALSGDPRSQYVLYGYSKPAAIKWRWLCRAAMNGDPAARFVMASYYIDGAEPVEKDYIQAYMWLTLSAHAAMDAAREHIAEDMTHEQIAQAELLAAGWQANLRQCEMAVSPGSK
jgi:hypothetical protein